MEKVSFLYGKVVVSIWKNCRFYMEKLSFLYGQIVVSIWKKYRFYMKKLSFLCGKFLFFPWVSFLYENVFCIECFRFFGKDLYIKWSKTERYNFWLQGEVKNRIWKKIQVKVIAKMFYWFWKKWIICSIFINIFFCKDLYRKFSLRWIFFFLFFWRY